MLRRSRNRGGPGLVGTMARTVVVAGTATAVAGSVAARQQTKQQASAQTASAHQAAFESQQQIAELQAQMASMQAQEAQAAMPATAGPTTGDDLIARIQQLARLKDAGALSDTEFEAAKAKLLGL
ncbi:MAG: SHOCT domain-containing protein [Thermomicrobiales bacterium]